MNPKPLLIAGLAYLLFRSGQKLSAVQQFHYDLAGLPAVAITNGQAVITVQILISNVTRETFNIKNIYGRLMLNNTYVGDIQSGQPFTIPGYGKTSVVLSVSVYLSNAVTSLISAIGAKTGFEISINGEIKTDTVIVPMSFAKRFN